jgi:hypothetical protein
VTGNLLGFWTTNRGFLRYTREEVADRMVRDFASEEALDPDHYSKSIASLRGPLFPMGVPC